MQGQAPKFLDYLKFRKGYIVSPAIFYINLILYVAVSLDAGDFWFPTEESIIKFGGNANFLTLDGDWWRIITSTFLHFGILHFASNMYALTRIGYTLESFVGPWRLLSAYLFAGITAGIASTWWHTLSVGAGASGAIFGMFGMFLALVTTEFVEKQNRWPLVKNIGITIVINLAIGTQFHIDNAAHIGGLIGGIFAGYLIYGIYKTKITKRTLAFCMCMLVFSAALYIFVFGNLSKNPIKINATLLRIETQKDSLLNVLDNAQKNKLNILDDTTAIFNKWNQTEKLFSEIKDLEMEGRVHTVILKFEKEIKLRNQESQLLLKIYAGQKHLEPQLKAVQLKLSKIMQE